jgi:hypothetical protein
MRSDTGHHRAERAKLGASETRLNAQRSATTLGFVVVGVIVFFLSKGNADSSANDISRNADANEATAESAPQQQVVASWAIRDAEIEQVRQNGVRNGLLGVCAAMLIAVAVSLSFREKREEWERRAEIQPINRSLPPEPVEPPPTTS